MTGASGEDVTLPVPPGTVIRDVRTGEVLGEAIDPDRPLLLAKGGRGGRGNARFATATHQPPREWEPGGEGEERVIPFHYREAAANVLTNTALDPVSKIPELKACAVRIERIEHSPHISRLKEE